MESLFAKVELGKDQWILWSNNTFEIVELLPKLRRPNRETLARFYHHCVMELQKTALSVDCASQRVRLIWNEQHLPQHLSTSLPLIIGKDIFLRMYALGAPLPFSLALNIWRGLYTLPPAKKRELAPIYVEWNPPNLHFNDIDATPPGLLSKFFTSARLRKDKEQLSLVSQDLEKVAQFKEGRKRMWLSLAILSHGAAYRELEGQKLKIPSFTLQGSMVTYFCKQHLIAEGIKTVSLIPENNKELPIYLCQGTELWPSQPFVLGSILANFAEHGSATEAYAHSWRRIHKQLRDLPRKPLVAGHSMGGSLAMQMGLYSHNLVEEIFAFNPPMPNERDYLFYHSLSEEAKGKIQVIANLDDVAFWRMGSKVIGKVTLFLSKRRWKYHAIQFWDALFLIPAFIKFMRNARHAFPAHQNIAALYENWLSVTLTQEEIEEENAERLNRFDYFHFFPKLYNPLKFFLNWYRKIFKWSYEKEYLHNEIEIVSLHERELIDTLEEANQEELKHELQHLRKQKELLIKRLLKL